MNKAFVKESEEHGDRCPSCGSHGIAVFQKTLAAYLRADQLAQICDSASFCPHETCPVAYFDRFERTIPADELQEPVYPKDPQAPICPCFGLTVVDIEAEVEAGSVERLKAHLQRAQSDEACCSTKSPSGQACVAAVQKCYMKLRGQR